MTQLKCPACNTVTKVKRLGFNPGVAANGITPQNAVCDNNACQASNPTAQWIANTPGCTLAADTYFFGGAPKKTKFFANARMGAADQAGPGTGAGQRQAGDARVGNRYAAQPTSDVSIHVVEDDVTLIGEFCSHAGGGNCVLILNGSGDDIYTYRHDQLQAGFEALGHSSLSVDYRGYGVSSGTTSKQGLYTDARAMLGYLTDCRGFALTDIVIHGWSIGSVPAVETTLRLGNNGLMVKGLILQCPISSTYDAARTKDANPVEAAIGARLLGGMNNYSKLYKVDQLHIPILILKGANDTQGFQDMADKLHNHANNSTLSTFQGGHQSHAQIFQGPSAQAINLIVT